MMEIFKDILGCEGLYQVSNLGRVKSLSRTIMRSNGRPHTVKEKILNLTINTGGYYAASLQVGKKRETKIIHQLVAIVFLNHKTCGMSLVVNHKDLNKLNNKVDNLEIVTNRENCNRKHIKSSSKYLGVSWDKRTKRWKAEIYINGKNIYLGRYTSELEASKAYQNKLQSISNN